MVESDFGAEKGDDVGLETVRVENDKPVLRREPSFSGWCDEDGIEQLDCPSNHVDSSTRDRNFELPLLQGDRSEDGYVDRERQRICTFRQRSMHLNGGDAMEDDSANLEENGHGKKHVSFSIENDSGGDLNFSDFNLDDLGSRRKLEMSQAAQSGFSVALVLRTLFFVLIWYISSTCLTLYNKTLLGEKLGKFPAPMLMNTVHFTMQAVLSKVIIRFCCQKLKPSVEMSWKDYFMRVVPTAIGTALDVNLSNASLVFISVTFATMCKSASPIFLLLFAFAFKLEHPSIMLLAIILVISAGVLLTVAKETEFKFWGFVFVMLAAVMSGFRWSMTQILLQKEAYGLRHPLTLMSYVSPVMAVATALFSLVMDPWLDFRRNNYFNNSWHILRSCMLMAIGGSLAFLMVLTEYFLVSVTSAVTVTIAGVVKEAVTILVAVFYFHDDFTLMKGVGLVTIMVGVSLFNWYKYQKLQKNHEGENAEETGSANGAAKYVILENMDDQDDEA